MTQGDFVMLVCFYNTNKFIKIQKNICVFQSQLDFITWNMTRAHQYEIEPYPISLDHIRCTQLIICWNFHPDEGLHLIMAHDSDIQHGIRPFQITGGNMGEWSQLDLL